MSVKRSVLVLSLTFGLGACGAATDPPSGDLEQGTDGEPTTRDRSSPPIPVSTALVENADFRLQAVSFALEGGAVWLSGTEGRYAHGRPAADTNGPVAVSWTVGQVLDAQDDQLLQFRDVTAISATRALLLAAGDGPASRIYSTSDGGVSWSLRWHGDHPSAASPSLKPVFLDCMDFWDARRGLVFGDTIDERLFVLATQDGGDTWQRLLSSPAAHPSEGGFAASGDCLLTAGDGWAGIVTGAGPQPRIVVTENYGQSWTSHDLPLPSGETGGAFALAVNDRDPAGSAWFVAGGDLGAMTGLQANVIVSRDQGANWEVLGVLPFEGPVYGLAVDYRRGPGAQTLMVVGPGGTAWSVDGGETFKRWLDQDHWSVALSGDMGLMVGPEGRVTRFALGAE